MKRSHTLRITIPTLLLMVGIVYYVFDPTKVSWMPQCYAKQLTGYDCPGCGAQRGLHALLHGQWIEALRHNYLLVVAIPLLLFYVVTLSYPPLHNWTQRLESRKAAFLYLTTIFSWWILRNVFTL